MKKIWIIITVAAFVLSLTTVTLLASTPAPVSEPESSSANEYGFGCATGRLGCYGLMWDEDGAFVSKEVFSERLDKAIEDGIISADDKEYFLEKYDYCTSGEFCGNNNRGNAGGCGRVSGGCDMRRAA